MRALNAVLFSVALIIFAAPASAAPKTGSGGQTCDESESNVKHDIGGKHYTCDKCVYSVCSTSGGTLNNCVRKTEWSNCVAAAGGGGGGAGKVDVDRMAPPASSQPKGQQPVTSPKKQ
jgi:hypothetical protein